MQRFAELDERPVEDDGFTLVETLVTLVSRVGRHRTRSRVRDQPGPAEHERPRHDDGSAAGPDGRRGPAAVPPLHDRGPAGLERHDARTRASSPASNSSGHSTDGDFQAVLTPLRQPQARRHLLDLAHAPTAGLRGRLNDYDAVNSSTVFTYYYNNYSVTPVVLASTTTPTNAQLSEIVAVAVDVTFLAGPHKSRPRASRRSVRRTFRRPSTSRTPRAPRPRPRRSRSPPERDDRSRLPAHR